MNFRLKINKRQYLEEILCYDLLVGEDKLMRHNSQVHDEVYQNFAVVVITFLALEFHLYDSLPHI